VLQADDRNWAEYVASLLHNAGTPASPETKSVIKVVRYGNTLLALPDEATVERVERVIEKYHPPEPRPPSWLRQDPEED
jgi:hypothetical protein